VQHVRGRNLRALIVAPLSASMLLFAGFVPAHAGAATARPAAKSAVTLGTLEVCKAAANGMSGRAFQFSVNGGAAFAVTGGGCSGPMSVASGSTTVVETATADTQVAAIKANHLVSKDLSSRSATVTVKAGSTPANETLVTYTNKSLPVLGLKVCKAAAANSPGLVGQSFSFGENGKAPFSVAAGTVAAPNCGPVTKFKLGTVVNVSELATAGTFVSGITVSDGRGSNVNTAAGTVTATIGAGVTVVTYTNAVNPVGQLGYVEVCKSGADEYVTGSFDFTITGSAGFTASRSVLVDQCTEPIAVPAGQVTVAEAARFPYATTAIAVGPAGRLVSKNLANRTTTVTVPVGDVSTETLVTFTNATLTGQLKICKTLAPNSAALAGQSFRFFVNAAVGLAIGDTIVAGPAGSTTCVIHPEALPLGSAVSITENGTDNVTNTTVTVAPASRDTGSAPPTANLTIGTGFTTATFTNQAYGTVEVCKIAADPSTAIQTFQFKVNGGAAISVKAGQCSLPIAVPAGTATVQELANPNFHLVGVTADGPTGDIRLLTNTNPVTVSVPFGGVENETAVTFTNAVNTGQFKICKVSSEPSLQNVSFNFEWAYELNFTVITGSASLKPGQCSSLSAPIPVVDGQGFTIQIGVEEDSNPQTVVSNIAVANGTLVASNLKLQNVTFNVNQGVTAVTYTNVRKPLGTIQICKNPDDPSSASQTFQFSVNGGAAISVKAGSCSPVMSVLSGTATVEELSKTNFHLERVEATGPSVIDNRLTTGTTDNPATATVPPGTGADTTKFTFTNAVDTSELILCKQSPDVDLATQSFHFDVSFTYTSPFGSGQGVSSADLMPGQCTADGIDIPVVDPSGNPIPVVITETPVAGVTLDSVQIDNGNVTTGDFLDGTATINVLAPGQTKVTFTNTINVNPCIVHNVRTSLEGFVSQCS
jgi:hypothetical protein